MSHFYLRKALVFTLLSASISFSESSAAIDANNGDDNDNETKGYCISTIEKEIGEIDSVFI